MFTARKTLLADAIGAVISTFCLGLISLLDLNSGLSDALMYMLTAIAAFFALYSFTCYFLAGDKWRVALSVVLCANFLYSLLTAYLLWQHRTALSVVEAVYFPLEIMVLWVVCVYEFRQVKLQSQNN